MAVGLIDRAILTPERMKQTINLLCKDRKASTKLVYTRAFRAHALGVLCDFIEHMHGAPRHTMVDQMEELFSDYEAAHGIYPASGLDVVFVRPRATREANV
jgi:hypothetical protein